MQPQMPQTFHHELLRTIREFILQLERDLAKLAHRHLRVFHPCRHRRALCRDLAINQREHAYLDPEIFQLAGHLKSDNAPTGETDQMDWTRSLPSQNFANIIKSQCLQTVRLRSVDQIHGWLNAENRAVRRKLTGHRPVDENVSQK